MKSHRYTPLLLLPCGTRRLSEARSTLCHMAEAPLAACARLLLRAQVLANASPDEHEAQREVKKYLARMMFLYAKLVLPTHDHRELAGPLISRMALLAQSSAADQAAAATAPGASSASTTTTTTTTSSTSTSTGTSTEAPTTVAEPPAPSSTSSSAAPSSTRPAAPKKKYHVRREERTVRYDSFPRDSRRGGWRYA